METGTVKWYSIPKGWGFIENPNPAADAPNPDIFVHHSVIDMQGWKTLEEGQSVAFEVKPTERGLCATYVNPCPA